jgi:hypothetical protein
MDKGRVPDSGVQLRSDVLGLNRDKIMELVSEILCFTLKFVFFRNANTIYTGGPYMREIGTLKICSNIMNSHIKRPIITVN